MLTALAKQWRSRRLAYNMVSHGARYLRWCCQSTIVIPGGDSTEKVGPGRWAKHIYIHIYGRTQKTPMQQILIFWPVNFQTCIFTCTPEGYRKDTGRVTDPLTDLLTDPLTDLLTDPLTDLLKDLLTKPSIEGPDWKTEAGLETRPAGRIPEGFQTILVIWSPGPLWRPVKLRNAYFTCTPEGYRKDTGRVPDIR